MKILEVHENVKLVSGDIFASPMQTLVNPVNTVGVMGKGLALKFKEKYPEMFSFYRRLCTDGDLDIGLLYLCEAPPAKVGGFRVR
jgi:O-acetyl-ADP-ribose deacetylase (regulator of RNase III)